MNAYMVSLVDRLTGEDQRVLVEDRNPDRDWQEWVDNMTFDPPLTIKNPVVSNVTPLPISHLPRRTTFSRPVATV